MHSKIMLYLEKLCCHSVKSHFMEIQLAVCDNQSIVIAAVLPQFGSKFSMILFFALIILFLYMCRSPLLIGPQQANLVLIAHASSDCSSKPAHLRSLARTSACSLIQAVSLEESSDRKPDPWPL